MKIQRFFVPWVRRAAALVTVWAGLAVGQASDHADPMSLDVFKLQDEPEANITDLHAFVVDKDGNRIKDQAKIGEGTHLIVSLCARRRLLPNQIAALDLKDYSFRLHLDLDPKVRIWDGQTTVDGLNYETELKRLNDDAAAKLKAVDEAREAVKKEDSANRQQLLAQAQAAYAAANGSRTQLVARRDLDRSNQALYGGSFPQPGAINPEVTMDFHLDLIPNGELSEVRITSATVEGMTGPFNPLAADDTPLVPGVLNVRAGIYDDPFIFPRFFRANVVGIVTSIPLDRLRKGPNGSLSPILLWATTHGKNGKQIDHVGRSLRTQLPRFGYLNDLPPSAHVAKITEVHDKPNLIEDISATFIAPLIAHRHYDSAPDVMIFDMSKPAKFPNGRAFEDDVAASLAEAGETLLLELSYAESRQFPRSTVNDKQFRDKFPYLAPRWTADEQRVYAGVGTVTPTGFVVPNGPDLAAIAAPNLKDATWRSLVWLFGPALIVLFVLLWKKAPTFVPRLIAFVLAVIVICKLMTVYQANNPMNMAQAGMKLRSAIWISLILTFMAGWVLYAWGYQRGTHVASPTAEIPPGEQGMTSDDFQSPGSSYDEIRNAILANPYREGWSLTGRKPLPVYPVTFRNVAVGLFSSAKRFLLFDASKRTLQSRSDLRWGKEPGREGFRRMLHPNGICLIGEWIIDDAPPGVEYTGAFKPGTRVPIIARYSICCGEPRRGHTRSQSLVGKLFLPEAKEGKHTPVANFITQEDFGGTDSRSINEVILRNAPDVTPWRRGSGTPAFLITALALMKADRNATIRQLYEIAELGKPVDMPTNCPNYMELRVAASQPTVGGDDVDFRDEILEQIYGDGTEEPRELVFTISVSDAGEVSGFPGKKLKGAVWTPIGRIVFKEAVVSYNGDHVIHFRHPAWRENRNNPAVLTGPSRFWRIINRIFG